MVRPRKTARQLAASGSRYADEREAEEAADPKTNLWCVAVRRELAKIARALDNFSEKGVARGIAAIRRAVEELERLNSD